MRAEERLAEARAHARHEAVAAERKLLKIPPGKEGERIMGIPKYRRHIPYWVDFVEVSVVPRWDGREGGGRGKEGKRTRPLARPEPPSSTPTERSEPEA